MIFKRNRTLFILSISLLIFGGTWWFVREEEPLRSPYSLYSQVNEEQLETPSPTPESEEKSFGTLIRSFISADQPTPVPIVLPPLPEQKILSGGSHTFQTFNNCGPASLSMLLSYYGISETQQTLGQQLRPHQNSSGDNDDKSVTLAEVAVKAREYGFLVYHRPAGNRELIKQFIAQDMPVLARTWLTPGEDIGHFRVVRGYDQSTQEFIQDDSLQGAGLRYTYEDFEELWGPFNYEFLVLVPAEKQAIAEAILGELLNEQTAWEKSRALAEQRQAENPNNIYAAFNLSSARYKLGDYAGAIEAYESVAERLPSRMLWYQIEPILAYWKAGQTDEVLRVIDRILTNQNRAFSELYFIRGSIYQSQGNQALANEEFSLAEAYNPTGSWRVNVE